VRSYDAVKDTMLWGDDIPWSTLPEGGLQEVFALFTKAIDAASAYVYIEDQGINNSDFFTAHLMLWPLVRGAMMRGVKVICVTGGEGSTNLTLPQTTWDNLLNQVSNSVRSNFVVYRVADIEVHSKVVLIDDEFVSIGSANFWDRSMDGADTELTAAIVDPGSLVKDLRVRLWADHMRVDPGNATVKAELEDLNKSLGIFRPLWGTGVTFPHPDSQLRLIGPDA
jgi:phosphatidylserine/phosphatidylglycerophosphate/cardiolipin synthase-like enzyme